jgi:hypothetical protein
MNNRLFIVKNVGSEDEFDALRMRLEKEDVYDRYGDADVAVRTGRFGFDAVVPKVRDGKTGSFLGMLRCSYVYMPCGWHGDKRSRTAMRWARMLGKKVIFEEDDRCR